MRLTLIMAYYDNPTMLKKQLENIAGYSRDIKDRLELIVIDDCSPRWPATFEIDPGIPMQLYRTSFDIAWNQDFCRNLGAYKARTDWLLLTDIDHLVPESTMHSIFNHNDIKPCIVYKFSRINVDLQPYKPHPNSWLMTREFYTGTLHGYDERFAGYYGTDGDFRDRINKFTNIEQLPYPLIRVGRETIPDASTTTLERKKPEDGQAIARIKKDRGLNSVPLILSYAFEEIFYEDKIVESELA